MYLLRMYINKEAIFSDDLDADSYEFHNGTLMVIQGSKAVGYYPASEWKLIVNVDKASEEQEQ